MRGNELNREPLALNTAPPVSEFTIPMRGNESESFPYLYRTTAFTIPMRGNEASQDPLVITGPDEFTIPMRGNERTAVHRVLLVAAGFTIPMRGNETEARAAGDRHRLVYDPHEG